MAQHLKPRPLKSRPWTEAEQAWQWAHSLADQRPLFDGLMLSNLVISALVTWIRRKNPKAARFLMQKIKTVTAMERCLQVDAQLAPSLSLPPVPPSGLTINVDELLRRGVYGESLAPSERSMVNELMALLREIVMANVPNENHARRTLSDQQKWLTYYFEKHPVRLLRSDSTYKVWLDTHGEARYQSLCSFECLCTYRASLNEITEHQKKDLTNCKGLAPLIDILLAELHQWTPSGVRRYLSPPTNSSTTTFPQHSRV
jgi:hypothetical protein